MQSAERPDNGTRKTVVVSVTGVLQYLQGACRPALRQLPRRLKRTADIVTTVNEDPGDAVQKVGIAQELIVVQERRVTPVMRDQSCEQQPERRIVESRVRAMIGCE